jgi:hypothetical protein
MKAVLLGSCATALDQDNQHDHEQHAGSNPDKRGTVHVKSPFLRKQFENSQVPTGFGSRMALMRQGSRSVTVASIGGARQTSRLRRLRWYAALLGACAAALNQYTENDDKQDPGNDANQSGAVH